MKKIFTLILIIYPVTHTLCQGGWDIGYLEIGSINVSHVGKSVKIDFKHNSVQNGKAKWVRSYVIPEDSAIIKYEGKELIIIERREIYVDHGSFDDQYLEIMNRDNPNVERIYDAQLIEIQNEKLKFVLTIETFKKQSKVRSEKISTKTLEVWIDKENLDGFMIKLD
jgi:hypothetical protein